MAEPVQQVTVSDVAVYLRPYRRLLLTGLAIVVAIGLLWITIALVAVDHVQSLRPHGDGIGTPAGQSVTIDTTGMSPAEARRAEDQALQQLTDGGMSGP